MNNNNFIMRDQVHDLVPSIMGYESGFSALRFMRQISLLALSAFTFGFILF